MTSELRQALMAYLIGKFPEIAETGKSAKEHAESLLARSGDWELEAFRQGLRDREKAAAEK